MSRFQKGQGGRPKGAKNKHTKSLTKLLEERVHGVLIDKKGTKLDYIDTLLTALDSIIFSKDTPPQVKLNAIRFIFERIEGLPTQVIRQDTANIAEAFEILDKLTNEVTKLDIKVINSETNEETN